MRARTSTYPIYVNLILRVQRIQLRKQIRSYHCSRAGKNGISPPEASFYPDTAQYSGLSVCELKDKTTNARGRHVLENCDCITTEPAWKFVFNQLWAFYFCFFRARSSVMIIKDKDSCVGNLLVVFYKFPLYCHTGCIRVSSSGIFLRSITSWSPGKNRIKLSRPNYPTFKVLRDNLDHEW